MHNDISLNSLYNDAFFSQICREDKNTLFKINYFFHENRAVYEIKWRDNEKPDRSKSGRL